MANFRKLILTGAVLVFSAASSWAQDNQLPIYLNTAYSFEERATDLVSRLTLEEKQSLLGNNMAAVARLGLKNYNVWSEALHGVLSGANPGAGLLGPTSFPNSVAIGSTWDPAVAEWMAAAIAEEARAIYATGTKGLTFWSPVVEPVRDPRWGRTGESYGEDPFLAAEMARGFVRGMMGSDPKYLKAVPTAKHYFANNSEFDRHVSSSNMDGRDMREFYLYPYKRLIEDEHLPSIMSSYNAVNHVPTSASAFYLDTLARRTYGMKGYVTGDCAAIEDIWNGHYFVETREQATAAGLAAGVSGRGPDRPGPRPHVHRPDAHRRVRPRPAGSLHPVRAVPRQFGGEPGPGRGNRRPHARPPQERRQGPAAGSEVAPAHRPHRPAGRRRGAGSLLGPAGSLGHDLSLRRHPGLAQAEEL